MPAAHGASTARGGGAAGREPHTSEPRLGKRMLLHLTPFYLVTQRNTRAHGRIRRAAVTGSAGTGHAHVAQWIGPAFPKRAGAGSTPAVGTPAGALPSFE